MTTLQFKVSDLETQKQVPLTPEEFSAQSTRLSKALSDLRDLMATVYRLPRGKVYQIPPSVLGLPAAHGPYTISKQVVRSMFGDAKKSIDRMSSEYRTAYTYRPGKRRSGPQTFVYLGNEIRNLFIGPNANLGPAYTSSTQGDNRVFTPTGQPLNSSDYLLTLRQSYDGTDNVATTRTLLTRLFSVYAKVNGLNQQDFRENSACQQRRMMEKRVRYLKNKIKRDIKNRDTVAQMNSNPNDPNLKKKLETLAKDYRKSEEKSRQKAEEQQQDRSYLAADQHMKDVISADTWSRLLEASKAAQANRAEELLKQAEDFRREQQENSDISAYGELITALQQLAAMDPVGCITPNSFRYNDVQTIISGLTSQVSDNQRKLMKANTTFINQLEIDTQMLRNSRQVMKGQQKAQEKEQARRANPGSPRNQ